MGEGPPSSAGAVEVEIHKQSDIVLAMKYALSEGESESQSVVISYVDLLKQPASSLPGTLQQSTTGLKY